MQTWKLKKKVQKTQRKAWKMKVVAVLLLVSTVAVGMYDFPGIWNSGGQFVQAKTGWTPPVLTDKPFRLGLDLQGGTHLIYQANMSEISEEDRTQALQGVKDVIERRVNAFGVSEPVIQTTTTGGVYRIIIDLAGVMDVSEAIALIGETPVLEFKESGQEKPRDPTPEETAQLQAANTQERANAQKILDRALAGENFETLVLEASIDSNKETTKGMIENVTADSFYGEYASLIEQRGVKPGQVNGNLLEGDEGISVFKYVSLADTKQMELSHILICFEGKKGCASQTSAIDASIQIKNVKDQATPENFAELAKTYSTDPSAVSNSGYLGWGSSSDYVPAFSLAASALALNGISDVVETDYGYHLIYKKAERSVPAYTIQRVLMPFTYITDIVPPPSVWVNTKLSGKNLDRAAVEFDPNTGKPHVGLTFDQEGGELFGTLTESHVGQPIAIFLDGSPISTPVVQQAIYGGRAVITGDFTVDEAKLLAQRLNAGALPVPVELLSQQTVGPTLGAISLEKSIRAALFGFLLVALYMVIVYRLPGFISIVALVLFAFLNLLAYRLFGVTITLAGIAGLVLSLGVAVDANVLIIERFKEEFASGRDFHSAIDEAFKRAWSAIRDGNMTTLIATLVLYWFSSSFIKGFALTLSLGVILSMFTAILVTRIYLTSLLDWKALRKPFLFGIKKRS